MSTASGTSHLHEGSVNSKLLLYSNAYLMLITNEGPLGGIFWGHMSLAYTESSIAAINALCN